VYDEVIMDLKLLSLKSYDQSLHFHDFLNKHCRLNPTADFKFIEEILVKDKIDENLDKCMKERDVDLKSKFFHAYLAVQVKESHHGEKDFRKPLQDIISKQVMSNACKLAIRMEFETKLKNKDFLG